MAVVPLDEFCPKCGEWTDYVSPFTGFCIQCSRGYCITCGNRVYDSHKLCNNCRKGQWLERNANAIERVMAEARVTVLVAISTVADDNRPRCVKCGDPIRFGTRGRTLFCNKNDACRRAAIRYYNYRSRNHMSDEEALERALKT